MHTFFKLSQNVYSANLNFLLVFFNSGKQPHCLKFVHLICVWLKSVLPKICPAKKRRTA